MPSPVEQESPSVPRIEISPPTEDQLCKPGAVKLIYMQLSETRVLHSSALAELRAERERVEAASARASSSEATCRVLRERLSTTSHRHSIARLIEFVITVLLAYAIDFARSSNWVSFSVFILLSLVLGGAIILVDRSVEPAGGS